MKFKFIPSSIEDLSIVTTKILKVFKFPQRKIYYILANIEKFSSYKSTKLELTLGKHKT